jgi:glycosyltransferase involved in cell wall biosynthesis
MPALASWNEFAERFPNVVHLLQAQRELGLRLIWIALSTISRTLGEDEIKIKFVRAPKLFNKNFFRHDLSWNQARLLARAIADENPDVIHHHGLNSWMALRVLNKLARQRGIRCLAQDHGGGVPLFWMKRRLYQNAFAAIRQVVFGDAHTRDRWISRKLLAPERCHILFAASSVFKPAAEAERCRRRRQLQLEGAPILGWVAHLDSNKDPMTILRACAVYFEKNPAARLYMHFIKDGLRAACENLIAAHPALRQRVFLRGSLPHAQLEAFYQAIDYFLQGSHHEAYGYTAVEAMSTGAIPILTAIPSFRLLGDDGRCGFLFPPGDVAALQKILLQLPKTVALEQRARVIRRFQKEFSYPALAQKLLALYQTPGRTSLAVI